jgi:D-alanyl-D-alanine carboxypeptidase/D-alanyl-D-alanine-endopeptidase (penicillin-binding protein 4)
LPAAPHQPLSRALALAALALLCGGIKAPATAIAGGDLASLQADLADQLARAGAGSGAYVYDLSAQQPLFSERASALHPPASVEKLYTATSALALVGASGQLSTSLLGTGRLAPGGVWEGDLYLRGGGDPTFGSASFIRSHYGGDGASVSALASQLVGTDGIHQVTGSVFGDESYFDSSRGEPSSGYAYDPFLEGTLSGLAFNRGASGSERGAHAPAAHAAHELWRALKADGVGIHGPSRAALTPAGAAPLAQVSSPTLAQLLELMLPPSDNYFAETLIKDLGARYGGAGTTTAGAAVVRRTIASLAGVHPQLVDGSGLSRSDLTSPQQVADLLVKLAPTAIGSVLRADLAVAGRTGTLETRMRHTAAAGRCEGKTGSLIGVSNLAGYCHSADGHLLAFAIFDDGISVDTARTYQDHMAATIASY